jgi:hypothetical protein
VRSTKSDCKKIEHAVAKMLLGSRVTCLYQWDTEFFLVTIELHQSMRTLELTMGEYRKSSWRDTLFKSLNEWARPAIA